jgi:FKBP-type peptidyl-prolyl cis-trans isomerase (trigger factor)
MPKTTNKPINEPTDKKTETAAAKDNKKTTLAPNESVKINLEWSSVEPVYQKTLKHFAKDVKAEGFRVGNVPLAIVEAKVGREKIIDRVLQELLPAAYEAAAKKAPKKPITHPEFNPIALDKDQDWQLEAFFSIMPEVKLGDYKKVVKTAQKTALKFIEERNQEIAKEAAAHAKGEHKHEGEHDHQHAHEPLGENEQKEIKLQHIFKGLVDAFAPSIGELMLRQETQAEYERLLAQLKQYQIKVEDYMTQRQINIEQLSQELAGTVLSRLQLDFIMAAISQAEKLEVSEAEIKTELDKVTNLQMRQDLEKNQNYLNQIKANLLQKKTLDLLLAL